MGPCAASVTETGALIASISGGGETLSVIPISNATNLNGVGAGVVGWTLIAADAVEAASTTTVLNLTSHVARVGDAIFSQTGTAANQKAWSIVSAVTTNTVTLANALPATPSVSDQVLIMRPVLIAASGAPSGQSGTALMANIDSNYQNATSTGILKNEDAAHTTGDAGVASWGVRNDDGVTLTNTDLDYSPIAVGSKGQLWTQITVGGGGSSGLLSPVLQEDTAFSASNATMVAGAQAVSAIAQTVGATGDVAPPSMDLGNRLVTTYAPAGETWRSCSSEATGTASTTIKAGVPSHYLYITNINCSNNSTVPSRVTFSYPTGGVSIAIGSLTALAVGGYWESSFPVPLKVPVLADDLRFAMTTTSTATICCASGYISTI